MRSSKSRCRVMILVFAVVSIVPLNLKGEGLDSKGCPREGGPSREVIVLIDVSDPLSDKHKSELERILAEMTNPAASGSHRSLPMRKGERVTVYLLKTTAAPKEIIQICHPGQPKERPWYNALIQGRLIADKLKLNAEKQWKHFKTGLVDEVYKLLPDIEGEPQHKSPILETIAVVTARHASSRRAAAGAKPTHLIVISDLLQNTDMLSHYRAYPKPSGIPRELGSDLSRVHVSLFRLERHKYEQFQTPEHFYWWTDWVETMEGKVVWQQAL